MLIVAGAAAATQVTFLSQLGEIPLLEPSPSNSVSTDVVVTSSAVTTTSLECSGRGLCGECDPAAAVAVAVVVAAAVAAVASCEFDMLSCTVLKYPAGLIHVQIGRLVCATVSIPSRPAMALGILAGVGTVEPSSACNLLHLCSVLCYSFLHCCVVVLLITMPVVL